jgi:glucose-6-phosphate 1-epimerase
VHTETIDIPSCTGSVLDHGAHVMSWAPREHGPVVFTSTAAVYAEDTAIRGGVPVCFPWFGPGREPGAPYGHGFARTTTWRQVASEVAGDAQTVSYRLTDEDATDDYWPHAYEAVLTARFGAALTISLTVTNRGGETLSYEAALHTYLCVDDIARVRIEGLDGVDYVDKTADGQVRRQEGPVSFVGETDRVYASPGPVRVLDPAGGRQVGVSTDGATHVVVWNPWEEKAAGLPDLREGEWRRFVCVEAGRVLDGAVVLAPGESHTLSTTISV